MAQDPAFGDSGDPPVAGGATALPEPGAPAPTELARTGEPAERSGPGFLPSTPPRPQLESVLVRLIATAGVVGIGTAIGAIIGASNVRSWVIGLVTSAVTVLLAALLWRSRRL